MGWQSAKYIGAKCNTDQRHNKNLPGTSENSNKNMPKKHNLSDEEVADLKEAFSMFDIDGDGESFSTGGGR